MTRQEELVQAARKEYPEWEEAQCHYIDGAHYADSHPHWISVEELPKEDGRYLVVNGVTNEQEVFVYSNGIWWYNAYRCPNGIVTHWMPLPQPPIVEVRTIYDVMADESHAIATSDEKGGEE